MDHIFEQIITKIKKKFDCHTLILYGSRARRIGVTPSSDYDILAIRDEGEVVREAYEHEGKFVDAWVYPSTLDPSTLIRIKDGIVIFERGGFGHELLKKVHELFRAGPSPLPDWERRLTATWIKKMFQRSTAGDIEGNYRLHWLLYDLLESYFRLRNLWYLGPKESFQFLKNKDRPAYDAFEKALSQKAQKPDIEELIHVVVPH